MTNGLRVSVLAAVTALLSVTAVSSQGPQLSRVMREKLDHSKAILGAVVTSDWPTLDRESRALARAAQDPAWVVLTAPEYLRQSDVFQRSLQSLIEASAKRDLDAASKAEVELIGSCVGCHSYVTRRRMAR